MAAEAVVAAVCVTLHQICGHIRWLSFLSDYATEPQVRGDGVQAWVPRFELRGPVHLRSRDGAAYVPVGGGAPAAEDAAVEIVRDDEALLARRRVGGKVGFVFSHRLAGRGACLSWDADACHSWNFDISHSQ